MDDNRILNIIYKTIDEINEQRSRDERIEKSVNTGLFGDGAVLDSLGLVSLVTTLEQFIEEEFGVSITLLEASVFEKENPFKTVKTLSDYISSRLGENKWIKKE